MGGPPTLLQGAHKAGGWDIPGNGATGFMQVNQALTGRSPSVDVLLIAMVCEVFVSTLLKFYDVLPVQKKPPAQDRGQSLPLTGRITVHQVSQEQLASSRYSRSMTRT